MAAKPTISPGGRGAPTEGLCRAIISPTSGGSGGISTLLNEEGTVPPHTIEKSTENEPRIVTRRNFRGRDPTFNKKSG